MKAIHKAAGKDELRPAMKYIRVKNGFACSNERAHTCQVAY